MADGHTARILITGSRDWDRPDIIHDAIRTESMSRDIWGQNLTLVHGGAAGADRIAGYIGAVMLCVVELHPADWAQYGKRAGYVRNAAMVERGADVCLAFIKNNSRGATMCANLAEKAGIPVKRFILED